MATHNFLYSTTHSMGDFGVLHSGYLPPEMLDVMHQHCLNTPTDSTASARGLFPPEVMALLQQAHHSQKNVEIMKLFDGFALMTSPDHKILSIIKDEHLCRPESLSAAPPRCNYFTTPPHNNHNNDGDQITSYNQTTLSRSLTRGPSNHKCLFFSIAQNPKKPIQPFYMAHHDGLLKGNQISRFGSVNSVIGRFTEKIPFQMDPRVLYSAPCMGSVTGRQIEGPDSDFVKKVLLAALGKNGSGGGIYDTPLQISDKLSKLLLLRDPSKPICCARVKDGLIGYRNRNDNQQSLVFMAHSQDFNDAMPIPNMPIKLTKITYHDDSIKAPRIWVNKCPDSSLTPPIIPGNNTTMADVASIIEHALRVNSRIDSGCGNYPSVCIRAAKNHLLYSTNPKMGQEHTEACRRLLTSLHLDHNSPDHDDDDMTNRFINGVNDDDDGLSQPNPFFRRSGG